MASPDTHDQYALPERSFTRYAPRFDPTEYPRRRKAAITKLAAEDMIAVAETGRPPALAEIVDVDLADFPELHVTHPQYERRETERKKFMA